MGELSGKTAVVLGHGAFGSAVAVTLAAEGAKVTVIDPEPIGKSASGIAAGMLAPAFEAVLDPVSEGQFQLLARARDLWPEFTEKVGPTGLDRCGALLRAPAEQLDAFAASLKDQGARCERVGETLYTSEDWRLDPKLALAAMRRRLVNFGGDAVVGEAVEAQADRVTLRDGSIFPADVVVIACGYGGRSLAPELEILAPIKGQLLRFPEGGPEDGPILRSLLGYVVPSRDGTVAGATMEVGRSDVRVDQDSVDRLKVEAAWLSPGLGLAHANGFAGVRAASPDGLPLIGQSRTGAFLAAGARRNGWLFAPLAAAAVLRSVTGRTAADDAPFLPGRFIPG